MIIQPYTCSHQGGRIAPLKACLALLHRCEKSSLLVPLVTHEHWSSESWEAAVYPPIRSASATSDMGELPLVMESVDRNACEEMPFLLQ